MSKIQTTGSCHSLSGRKYIESSIPTKLDSTYQMMGFKEGISQHSFSSVEIIMGRYDSNQNRMPSWLPGCLATGPDFLAQAGCIALKNSNTGNVVRTVKLAYTPGMLGRASLTYPIPVSLSKILQANGVAVEASIWMAAFVSATAEIPLKLKTTDPSVHLNKMIKHPLTKTTLIPAFCSVFGRDAVNFKAYSQDPNSSQSVKTVKAMAFGAGTAPFDIFANHMVTASLKGTSFLNAAGSLTNTSLATLGRVAGARAGLMGISANIYYRMEEFLQSKLNSN